jgi:Flp pilus assembly protein protease CpaA
MQPFPSLNQLLLFGLVIAVSASVTDLKRREIPNWICVIALVGGLVANSLREGWAGLGSAALGAAIAFGIFLIRYFFFGMGGGDLKLMTGFGAILGSGHAFLGVLLSMGAGGILALAYFLVHRWKRAEGRVAIPYAPAIGVGSCLALVARLPI